ncbi:MAG: PKD domain-containing protein [Flavobacteriales bacterium]
MEKNFTHRIKFQLLIFLITGLFILPNGNFFLNAQSGLCTANTPYHFADLSASPNSTWISPSFIRQGNCCGTTAPDNCLEFSLLLHPNAVGIIFNIHSGAMPPGALFYQINCGPQTPVGQAICLNGPGPHTITFCKPGNNQNEYSIISIPEPSIGPDITINDGCMGSLFSQGYNPASITWNSINPGAIGQYNNYLSCSTCSSPNVQAQPGFPPFVDFQVCGVPIGGCVTTPTCLTVRVYFNSTLLVDILPINPTVCYGAAGTTITATGSGGTPPYQYLWSTGETTASIFVGAGTYQVILSDGSGCPPTTNIITVTEFLQPITAFAGNDTTICYYDLPFQLNGIVTGVTTGVWSNTSGTFSTSDTDLNTVFMPSQSEINSGSTSLILTTTNNGSCPPAVDTITISYVDFVADFNIMTTDVVCNGMSNGTAEFDVLSGLYAPYTLTWSTNPPTTGVTFVSGLAPGTYTLHISNIYGCDTLHTFVINEPPLLELWIDGITHVACFGDATGSVTLSATGGIPPYEYAINGGFFGVSPVFSGLSAGTYTVQVKDNNGCVDTETITIFEPSQLSSTPVVNNVSCFGGNDGTVFISAQGGVGPYTYSFNNSQPSLNQNYQSNSAGFYTYYVVDANGCVNNGTVNITQPTQLTLTSNQAHVTCFGFNDGIASVNVAGGTPPYNYLWLNNNSQSNTAIGLSPGQVSVQVTDVNNCTINHMFTINQPAQLTATFTVNHVSCFGGNNGSALINITGGTPGYTYAWSNGANLPFVSNLTSGYKYIEVVDVNGCLYTDSIFINQPPQLTLTKTINDVSCNGLNDGSVNINVQGGVVPYFAMWNNAYQGFNNTGLTAGTYSVSIEDANNCLLSDIAHVTEPDPLLLLLSNDTIICPNQTISLYGNATGGIAPYQYNWNPVSNNSSTINVSPSSNTLYSLYVTDANNCNSSTEQVLIDVWLLYQDSLLVLGGDICEGQQVNVSAQYIGAINQPQYNWNNGLAGGAGPHTVSPPVTTTYEVIVTDACNNSVSANVTVEVHPYPIINIVNSTLSGCVPLSVSLTNANNSLPGVVYSWNMGNGQIINGDSIQFNYVNDGVYTILLTATSPYGCQSQSNGSHIVYAHPNPIAAFSFNPTDISILSPNVYFNNQSIGASSYLWEFGDGTTSTLIHPQYQYQDTGYYFVRLIAENQYGCKDTAIERLTVKPYYNVYIPNAFTPDGDGVNDVFYVMGTGLSNEDFRMTIFDRWGKVVFTSNNMSIGWDGNHSGRQDNAKVDVFVYVVEVKDAVYGNYHQFRGHVSVIR